MKNVRSVNEWGWVTHTLALLFSIACLGLVIYCVIKIEDANIAKAAMGFSSGLLGVILGFYFNRERLTKESKEKDYFSSQYTELLVLKGELEEHGALLGRLIREIEEKPEEE